MSFNLLEIARSYFSNDLIGKSSNALGESESMISKAINGILPSVIGGLIDKSATSEGASVITKLSADQFNNGILNNISGLLGGGDSSLLSQGSGLLFSLFGGKTDALSKVIANFSGVKESTSKSLLSMVTPLILGLLGKHAVNSNLNSNGIAHFLNDQGEHVKAAMPAGLNVSNLFSWNTNTSNPIVETAPVKEKSSWMMPLLLVALAALAIWFFASKGCNKSDENTIVLIDSANGVTSEVTMEPANSNLGMIDDETGDWIYDAGDMVTIDLPNHAGQLTVGTNSTEYKLINFLNDNSATLDADKGNWFEFTNVHFKKGGAEITEASMDQLKNLVTISKAFPSAQFKLGGYTDNTGNDEINIPLSQKRAEAVAEMVKQLGAAKSAIVGAEGYGMQWPIADNITPEGRAQNRRVAVNVKAK